MVTTDILANNLDALKASGHKDVAVAIAECQENGERHDVIDTKIGVPTVQWHAVNGDQIQKVLLHSKYNPVKEAERFADANYNYTDMLLYGFGLGYHVRALFERLTDTQVLIVVEMSVPLLKLALSLNDFDEMLRSEQFILRSRTSADRFDVSFAGMMNGGERIIVHPASINCIDDDWAMKCEIWTWLMGTTTSESQQLALQNHKRNMSVQYPTVDELHGIHATKTAYVVSSGPSLEKNLGCLKHVGEGDVILAISSALRPILQQSVEPDYVVIMDVRSATSGHFNGVSFHEGPLLFANYSSSEAVELYRGAKYMYFTESFEGVSANCVLMAGGSVSTAAFALAVHMGCRRVVLVGQDLCYSGGTRHAANAGNDIDRGRRHQIPANSQRRRDIFGQWVSTRLDYLNVARWFTFAAQQNPNVEILNATEGGIPIDGIPNIKLCDLLAP